MIVPKLFHEWRYTNKGAKKYKVSRQSATENLYNLLPYFNVWYKTEYRFDVARATAGAYFEIW